MCIKKGNNYEVCAFYGLMLFRNHYKDPDITDQNARDNQKLGLKYMELARSFGVPETEKDINIIEKIERRSNYFFETAMKNFYTIDSFNKNPTMEYFELAIKNAVKIDTLIEYCRKLDSYCSDFDIRIKMRAYEITLKCAEKIIELGEYGLMKEFDRLLEEYRNIKNHVIVKLKNGTFARLPNTATTTELNGYSDILRYFNNAIEAILDVEDPYPRATALKIATMGL